MAATQTIHWAFPIANPLDGAHGTASLNNEFDDSARYVDAGANPVTLDAVTHASKTVKLDTASGCNVRLPAATGSGCRIKFVVTVLPSGGPHVIHTCRLADTMQGIIRSMDDTSANVVAFAAAAASNTITLNNDTTGGISLGEHIEVEDIAPNKWHVSGVVSNTNTPATMFSAALASTL